ncbi:L-fuculose-phosphate aldolase [Nocardia kruczakiae]|uniref:L-fuculose-phosphate aldolase n=1 Tax=Nocardia kruczakiae TaxID=261477 RepID=A0ABU1XBT3_9NOCA|nr:class II aldolase/adducin family protein [Nocardia kruczakiae]MDR7168007.1 L-fuculose-phosphate aldolase [Nocardia kruczakiae]
MTSSPTPARQRLAVNLALGSLQLSDTGHDDFNQGQISARLPRTDHFLIKSALCGFSEATPADMIVAEVDPELPVHRMAPPELPLHQAIYRARPDVNAIVHSHAPNTLVFGALDVELAALSHDAAPFVDHCPRFTVTSNTILDIETGRAVARALGTAPAAFLRNHGGVIVGRTLRHAVVAAQLLERACELQLKALATGVKFFSSTGSDIDAKNDYIYSDIAVKSYWDYGVRAIEHRHPHVRDWAVAP